MARQIFTDGVKRIVELSGHRWDCHPEWIKSYRASIVAEKQIFATDDLIQQAYREVVFKRVQHDDTGTVYARILQLIEEESGPPSFEPGDEVETIS